MKDDMDNNNERELSYKEYMGPDELKPYVTFSRKGEHYCIYCGKESDTREHVPSKAFLKEPYPTDLPVLPACRKCNNGFSDDESYTDTYIDCLKMLSGYSNNLSSSNKNRIYKNSAFIDAQNDLKSYYEDNKIPSQDRILRVLTKLAVGHLVYELTEGYGIDGCCIVPNYITYKFKFDFSRKEREEFESMIFMDDKILPIIGSRVFGKIYVIESVLQPLNGNDQKIMPLCFMDWTVVQEDNYQYIAWIEKDDTFHVRIIIKEFLYAEVVFPQR